jgi:hypothetical protein
VISVLAFLQTWSISAQDQRHCNKVVVRFQVLTAASIKFRVFWDVGQLQRDYTALHPRRLWTSTKWLARLRFSRCEYEDNRLLGCVTCSLGVDRRFRGAYCLHHQGYERPCWWRQLSPPKRQSTPRLHGAISQKSLIFKWLVDLKTIFI